MKKLTSILSLLAIAAGLTAAIAMTPAPKNAALKSSDTDLEWFDMNGNYLGPKNIAQVADECGFPVIDCAVGFTSINPETEEPVGAPTIIRGDHEL